MPIAKKPVTYRRANRRLWVCLTCGGYDVKKHAKCPVCLSRDLHHFETINEWQRYEELCLFREQKLLTDLVVHPEYPFGVVGNGSVIVNAFYYVPSFRYVRDGKVVIESIRGGTSDPFKVRLMKLCYGLDVTVIVRERKGWGNRQVRVATRYGRPAKIRSSPRA